MSVCTLCGWPDGQHDTDCQKADVVASGHGCDVDNEVTIRRGETLLGRASNGCGVWHWPNYGVTCSCLVTTNGSMRTLMRSWAAPTSLTPAGQAFFIGLAIYQAARRR